MTAANMTEQVFESSVGPVVAVTRPCATKNILLGVFPGLLGMLMLGICLICLSADMTDGRVLVGFLVCLTLGWLPLAQFIRRIAVAFHTDELYFRAGPGGVSVAFAESSWISFLPSPCYTRCDIAWKDLRTWTVSHWEINGIPLLSHVVFVYPDGREVRVPTNLFFHNRKTIARNIAAAAARADLRADGAHKATGPTDTPMLPGFEPSGRESRIAASPESPPAPSAGASQRSDAVQAPNGLEGSQVFAGAGTYRPGKRYRFSGRCEPVGVVTMLTVGLLAAAAGGGVYGGLQAGINLMHLPGRKLGVVVACALGIFVALAASKGIEMGKVRNAYVAIGVAAIAGIAALYFSWVVWIRLVGGAWVLDPVELVRVRASGGDEVLNVMIMVAEALFLLGWPVFAVCLGWRDRSFCERCGVWTKRKAAGPFLPVADVDGFLRSLKAGTLRELSLTRGAVFPNMVLLFDSCPSCDTLHVVSARIEVEPGTTRPKDLSAFEKSVRQLIVPAATVRSFRLPADQSTSEGS